MSYFEVFSLPRQLTLDAAALEKQFYELSRRLHPDRFAGRPAAEQETALEQSSQLNNAYRTLRDPIRRTEYLLKLEGVELEEQSKSATDEARATGAVKKQVVPPELLEEVFDLNMQLQEMQAVRKMGENDAGLRSALLSTRDAFNIRMADSQAELERLWTEWDQAFRANDETAKAAARDAMVALLNRRSYLRNLVRDVNEALEE